VAGKIDDFAANEASIPAYFFDKPDIFDLPWLHKKCPNGKLEGKSRFPPPFEFIVEQHNS
jgi:hypothetical protein